jgi:UPF0755 protein
MSNSQKKKQLWIWILVVTLIAGLAGGGVWYYAYQKDATNYAALSKSSKAINVHIKSGSTAKEIAATLADKKVLRSETAFLHYLKVHNITDLKAGYYAFSPNMTVQTLVKKLRAGGSAYPLTSNSTLTIREGETAADVAAELEKKTDFKAADFLTALNDSELISDLNGFYPGLLTSAIAAKDVRYRLEGYLYPATYDLTKVKSIDGLIDQMVATSYTHYKSLLPKVEKSGMTVQQVLTLASLVEREGIDKNSRRIIAGVFENRIVANMPLGSDIAVKYALNTDKTNLSNSDVQVDSPYNLYKYTGYGPGPFNSPSEESVEAVLDPKDRDKGYLYFVANLSTGKIYYSKTYDEHLEKAGVLEASNDSVASYSASKKSSESSKTSSSKSSSESSKSSTSKTSSSKSSSSN